MAVDDGIYMQGQGVACQVFDAAPLHFITTCTPPLPSPPPPSLPSRQLEMSEFNSVQICLLIISYKEDTGLENTQLLWAGLRLSRCIVLHLTGTIALLV